MQDKGSKVKGCGANTVLRVICNIKLFALIYNKRLCIIFVDMINANTFLYEMKCHGIPTFFSNYYFTQKELCATQ